MRRLSPDASVWAEIVFALCKYDLLSFRGSAWLRVFGQVFAARAQMVAAAGADACQRGCGSSKYEVTREMVAVQRSPSNRREGQIPLLTGKGFLSDR
jgi:hypothetical protein